MFGKVLFLGRKNCKYSKNLELYLKKRTKHLKVIDSNKKNILLKDKIYEYVFCFRSHIILKKNFIKKIKNAAINFHPGPPNYRGIGCVNYALFDDAKIYGSTCHLIENEELDKGKILNFLKFKIKKKDNLDTLLNRTYETMFIQAKKIIDYLLANEANLKILIKKNNHLKWSNKIKNLNDLNKFYEIDLKYNKKKFQGKIRATNIKNFKPYIMFHGKKFLYKE
jgi:methionyl-tRNA formyltransferase